MATSAQSATPPAAGAPEEKAASTAPLPSRTHKGSELSPAVAGLVVLVFALLGYCGYAGWMAYSEGSGAATSPVATSSPAAGQRSANSVPELKLNHTSKRRAAAVTPNPDLLGKENPFR